MFWLLAIILITLILFALVFLYGACKVAAEADETIYNWEDDDAHLQ